VCSCFIGILFRCTRCDLLAFFSRFICDLFIHIYFAMRFREKGDRFVVKITACRNNLVCVCVRARVRACVRARVRAFVRVRVCVYSKCIWTTLCASKRTRVATPSSPPGSRAYASKGDRERECERASERTRERERSHEDTLVCKLGRSSQRETERATERPIPLPPSPFLKQGDSIPTEGRDRCRLLLMIVMRVYYKREIPIEQ